jgi:phosphotransferase system enzyme I (PtsP)
MAGDPFATPVLMGLGVRSLSMSVASLLRVKWVVRSISIERARIIASTAMTLPDARSVRDFIAEELENAGLSELTKARR